MDTNTVSNVSSPANASASVLQPGVPAEHFIARQDEIRAVPEADLLQMNLDVLETAATVLGVIPELRALRPDLAAKLVDFDASRIERLESIALATYYAHTAKLAEKRRSEPLPELSEQGNTLRSDLYVAATALAKKGLVDPSSLTGYRGGPGYLQLSSDLGLLVKVLRDVWDAIQGKTAVTKADVDTAEIVGAQLVVGVGMKEQSPNAVVVSTLDRHRAFTLLVREYDEMRRAVAYLRWKERDTDKITPSLYSGRGNTNHKQPKAGEIGETEVAATPGAMPTTPATPPASTAAPAATPPAPAVEAGFPGSSPFKTA